MKRSVLFLFFISKKRINSKGLCPVYCRITARGRRCEISSGVWLKPDEFEHGQIMPLSEELKDKQKLLDLMKSKLTRIETDIRIREGFITAENIKEKYINGFDTKSNFNEIAEEYLQRKSKLVDIEFTFRGYSRYVRVVKQIKEFIHHQFKSSSYPISEIKQSFADDMYLYFLSEKKQDPNTIARTVQVLKAIVDFAVVQDYAQKNYISQYQVRRKRTLVAIKHLSIEQIKTLYDAKLESYALQFTRDCFLFQCFTGLAYVDLSSFSLGDVKSDNNRAKWIILSRAKTGSKSTIPLLKEAEAIINRYQNLDHKADTQIKNSGVLPVYCNAVYNRLLKQIGLICNINPELMSSHTARKTFATIALNEKGISIETVSKMLGHSKISMTQKHYAHVNTAKIAQEMQHISFIN